MVARQVDSDPNEPGFHAGFAAKRCSLLVSAQKAILRQVIGEVAVSDQRKQHTEDSPLMGAHNVVEFLAVIPTVRSRLAAISMVVVSALSITSPRVFTYRDGKASGKVYKRRRPIQVRVKYES